jgi:hypothetical protein
MFQRDRERLADVRRRVNRLPLGAAALAGTTFPIDRHRVAKQLGFEGVIENSMDAVSDRDFLVEFLAAASLVMTHLVPVCRGIHSLDQPFVRFCPSRGRIYDGLVHHAAETESRHGRTACGERPAGCSARSRRC